MDKFINKSTVLAAMFAVISVLAGFIFYKTTVGCTSLIASTCGFLVALFVTIVEFVYIKIIKDSNENHVVPELVGSIIGSIILLLYL